MFQIYTRELMKKYFKFMKKNMKNSKNHEKMEIHASESLSQIIKNS